MGGQDGFSRDTVEYSEEANTILGGLKFHPGDRWKLGFSLGYTKAEASMGEFDLAADEYVAITPPMWFNWERTPSYSNLDVSRFNGDIELKFDIVKDIWLRFMYRYIDFTDDAPYLYDTSGTAQWATLWVGFKL
jgi:hypothetical protein